MIGNTIIKIKQEIHIALLIESIGKYRPKDIKLLDTEAPAQLNYPAYILLNYFHQEAKLQKLSRKSKRVTAHGWRFLNIEAVD